MSYLVFISLLLIEREGLKIMVKWEISDLLQSPLVYCQAVHSSGGEIQITGKSHIKKIMASGTS